MLLQNTNLTKAQLHQQKQNCEKFAAPTAEAIGTAGNCLFSLLPYAERFRQAASWYEACTQAMLRGNYAPLDEWIRRQACLGAEQHFELEDFLQLLRICRRSAIDVARWDEDVFSSIDEVINEGLLAVRDKVPWNIQIGLNYLKDSEAKTELVLELDDPEPAPEMNRSERRVAFRNRLALPIRVRVLTEGGPGEEITFTQNVSLRGVYFRTLESYPEESLLQVTYPFWTDHGSINREYPARIVRLDRLPDKAWGIALEFLQNLHDQTK